MILVDFSILYYRFLFASKTEVIANPDYLAHLLMTGVFANFKDYEITKKNRLVLAVDCNKMDNWRYKYYEEHSKDFKEYNEPVRQLYKSNRRTDNEIPWDRVREILEDFLNALINYSDIQVIQHPRAEADDVIAAGVKAYRDDEEIDIISADSDFHQLLSPTVKLYNPIQKKYITVENSKNALLEAIMTGQKRKDNIYPIKKGYGAKTAQKKMKELKDILKKDEGIKDRFKFNKTLIDLNMVPEDISDEIVDMYEEDPFQFNYKKMVEFCHQYKLRSHMDSINLLRFPKGNSNALY